MKIGKILKVAGIVLGGIAVVVGTGGIAYAKGALMGRKLTIASQFLDEEDLTKLAESGMGETIGIQVLSVTNVEEIAEILDKLRELGVDVDTKYKSIIEKLNEVEQG